MTLKIKRIPTTPIIDVFQNDGWETWTRLLWKNQKLIPLKGATLSDEQLVQIKDSLTVK
jgi:hypothetical protein